MSPRPNEARRRLRISLSKRWSHLDGVPEADYPDRLLHHSETRALLPVVIAELAAEGEELENAA